MSNLLIEDSTLTGIANAIRGKEGSSNPIQVRDLAQRIANLPSGGGTYSLSGDMSGGTMLAELLNAGLDVDTSGVTDMGSMFYMCQSTTVDLSSFDTSSVTNMGSMFRSSKFTQLDLRSLNTSLVHIMSYMFDGATSITSLDLSNFDTEDVSNMTNMFSGMTALTTLNLRGFDTRNVTSMSSMFNRLTALTSITFGPLWITPSSGTYTNQTTGTWTNTVTGVSYTGLQALLEAGRTLGAIEGTWVKS